MNPNRLRIDECAKGHLVPQGEQCLVCTMPEQRHAAHQAKAKWVDAMDALGIRLDGVPGFGGAVMALPIPGYSHLQTYIPVDKVAELVTLLEVGKAEMERRVRHIGKMHADLEAERLAAQLECRFVLEPTHTCADKFGGSVRPGTVCHAEAQAQLRDGEVAS